VIQIKVSEKPTDAQRKAIFTPLVAYNAAMVGDPRLETLALLLEDLEKGEIIGGLWGKFFHDWLFIELLFVPEDLRERGFGANLMARAESAARDRQCVGIWLDTHSFQAPVFYKKLGYEVFGSLDDYPIGASRHFLSKSLRTPIKRGDI